MPARSCRLPKYRLHKPTGQALVEIHGQRTYLGKFGSPESEERYGKLIAELAAGKTLEASKTATSPKLVVEILARYWDFAEGYYVKGGRPSGWLAHIRLTLAHVRRLYANTPAIEFGPLAFKAVRQTLIDAKHSRGYINKLMAIVPRVFKWAAAEELVPITIYQALKAVEGLKKGRCNVRETCPVKPVADRHVDETLPHLPPVVSDMVRFQRFTGCRPGEVCRLRPADVDRSGDVWAYRPTDHKTAHQGRERVIWIGPKAQRILQPYLLRPAHVYCFSPAESEEQRHEEMRAQRKSPVQPSQRHRRKARRRRPPADHYVRDSYARAIRRTVDQINKQRQEEAIEAGQAFQEEDWLPRWRPNQLRHSVGTEVRRQFGLEAAQTVLGHAKADVTQVYAERDAELAKEVMRKIG